LTMASENKLVIIHFLNVITRVIKICMAVKVT